MPTRTRRLAFGAAGLLVLAGFLLIVLVDGVTADVIGFVVFSVAAIGAIALGFLEIGLSEERQRARDAERRR